MKFRNYCLVVIGPHSGVKESIEKISESIPNILDAKGLFIATFSSVATPSELTAWFSADEINFMIFDLDSNSSGYNLVNPEYQEGLFGFLKKSNIEDKTTDLLREIHKTANTKNNKIEVKPLRVQVKKEKVITEKDVANMTKIERENLFNSIFNKIADKGAENVTANDKKVLGFLAKY